MRTGSLSSHRKKQRCQQTNKQNNQPRRSYRDGRSPGHDDEEVQAVPGVSQVTAAAEDAQGHHLHHHLQGEEDVDEGVKGLRTVRGEKVGAERQSRRFEPSNYSSSGSCQLILPNVTISGILTLNLTCRGRSI